MTLLEVRDATLTRVGVLDGYSTGQLIPRYCGVGSWRVTAPARTLAPEVLTALTSGGGIIATLDDGGVILSGPVVRHIYSRSSTTGPDGSWELQGVSDEIALADRLAYPLPTAAASAQTDAYDDRTGTAEAVLKAYVDANAGPSAILARRSLTIETSAGRGAAVAASYRFANLLDVCRELAVAGGIGFRVVQIGAALQLQVTVPVDRSGSIRLSFDTGTLRALTLTRSAPDLTRVIVAGQGVGAARNFREVASTSAEATWARRIERSQDRRDTNDNAVLDQAGATTLSEGAAKAGLKVEPVDTDQTRFGRDYNLGDVITAGPIADVVREVVITLGRPDLFSPVVGDPSSTDTPDLYERIARLERDSGRRATAD